MRAASLEAFLLWLLEQPERASWAREDACCCPLHDFIEAVTGESLTINSPEISEHWAERETQSYPTPWWMVCLLRSVDYSGEGSISKDELLSITLILVERDFGRPVMSADDWLEAAA